MRIAKAAGLVVGLGLGCASAQQLLPNGQQQFVDANGAPLAGGSVYFYIPNTTTPKFTYQDPGQSVPNSNPVILNSAGRGVIWGSGQYREILYDQFGNLVWDQLTSGMASPTGQSQGFGAQVAVSSATTTNLGSAGTNNVLVTGNVTVTGFGAGASVSAPVYLVQFQSSLTLVYNATSLVLPGARNISTQPGDSALAVYLGVGNWEIVEWLSKAADPLATGFGAQATLAAAATTDLGSVAGNNDLISGTGNITSFGGSATVTRPVFRIKFDSVAGLIYDATAMQLLGGGNILTAAGDSAVMEYLGGGNWKMLSYSKAAGSAGSPSLQGFAWASDGAFSYTLGTGLGAGTQLELVCVGPGGGGGSNSGGSGGGGGGGGSGGWGDYLVSGFGSGQTLSVTVGGVGGTGSTSSGSAGGNGNANTKFTYAGVDFLTCAPGVGGASGTSDTNLGGAAGAVSTNFAGAGLVGVSMGVAGGPGGSGHYEGSNVGIGGQGGSNPLGAGATVTGVTSGSTVHGANGAGYGAGGAGGATNGGTQSTGGNGTGGVAQLRGVF